MPTRYKPERDHRPLGWGSAERGEADPEVERLVAGLRSNTERIGGAFRQCGRELAYDDLDPLLDRLQVIIIRFVAECRAHPMRTARQLLPTVKEIRQDPERFLIDVGKYSPEAVAIVYEMFLLLFPGKLDLAAFEAGEGSVPSAHDIWAAADVAVGLLEQEAERQNPGRPKMVLVDELAASLAGQFRGLGGHLRRTVSETESGPFLSFVEAVVEPARTLVGVSGYSLNPVTMVRWAHKNVRADD